MAALDEILAGNAAYVQATDALPEDARPAAQLAIVTCMDARIDVLGAFGIDLGDAHVIRNAGALVTEDVERSLVLSQYALGTTTILVAAHTRCGVLDHDEEATATAVHAQTGHRPDFPLGTIPSAEEGVRGAVTRLRDSNLLKHTDDIHGLVLDIETGRLTPIE